MKLSEYISDKQAVDSIYSGIDYLNMMLAVIEVSTPWRIKRVIANDDASSNMNFMLDSFDTGKFNAIQKIQQNVSRLFREALKKYFLEKFGLENGAEVSVVYNENFLEVFVLADRIVINYSSLEDMVDKVLNYDTNDLFNHRMLRFVYTLYNMSGSKDGIWIEIKRNGTAIFCTNDGLAIKIKHSFYTELKHIAALSEGKRKENAMKALVILEHQ